MGACRFLVQRSRFGPSNTRTAGVPPACARESHLARLALGGFSHAGPRRVKLDGGWLGAPGRAVAGALPGCATDARIGQRTSYRSAVRGCGCTDRTCRGCSRRSGPPLPLASAVACAACRPEPAAAAQLRRPADGTGPYRFLVAGADRPVSLPGRFGRCYSGPTPGPDRPMNDRFDVPPARWTDSSDPAAIPQTGSENLD